MDYTYLALNMLSKYLGVRINLEDTASESNIFEVEDLDHSILPARYRDLLAEYSTVMTHLYAYNQLIAYVIYPYPISGTSPILIGLMQEDELLNFKIIMGGV